MTANLDLTELSMFDYDNTHIFPSKFDLFSNFSFYRLVMDLGPIAQNRTELELIQRLPRDFQEFTNTLRELELFNRTAVRRGNDPDD